MRNALTRISRIGYVISTRLSVIWFVICSVSPVTRRTLATSKAGACDCANGATALQIPATTQPSATVARPIAPPFLARTTIRPLNDVRTFLLLDKSLFPSILRGPLDAFDHPEFRLRRRLLQPEPDLLLEGLEEGRKPRKPRIVGTRERIAVIDWPERQEKAE